jgi:hypothetical protein
MEMINLGVERISPLLGTANPYSFAQSLSTGFGANKAQSNVDENKSVLKFLIPEGHQAVKRRR